jgi:hypothetical protein
MDQPDPPALLIIRTWREDGSVRTGRHEIVVIGASATD